MDSELQWFRCPACGSLSGMTPDQAECVGAGIRCDCGTPLVEIDDPVAAAERERDEAVALLRDIRTSVQDIDPRMHYVEAQITREELAAIDARIARLDHD